MGMVTILVSLCACVHRAHAAVHELRVVSHVHSTYSHKGKHSLDEIARFAEERGIDAVITGDDGLEVWEWGLAPWRSLIKRRIELPSVFGIGIERYLDAIKRVHNEHAILMIPGLEVTPHYFWQGTPLQESWRIHHTQKHVLVFGMSSLKQWRRLPIMHNNHAKTIGWVSILMLWPFVLGAYAIWYRISKPKRSTLLPYTALVIAVISAINYFPFTIYPFTQYKPEYTERPYQYLFDYVKQHGGCSYWAHPESHYLNNQTIAGITIKAAPYAASLEHTYGYTGFGYFYEGMKQVGVPGGIWDAVLKEYTAMRRQQPIWAMGELDWIAEGQNGVLFGMVDNIIFAQERSAQAITDAMADGRYYVRLNQVNPIRITTCAIQSKDRHAEYGQTFHGDAGDRPVLHITADTPAEERVAGSCRIIHDGTVVYAREVHFPLDLTFPCTSPPPGGKGYYRIELKTRGGSWAVTNPIFIVNSF